MATKAPKVYINIRGTAMYPAIHALDTYGKFPTNKFKVDILPNPEELARFKKAFNAAAKEARMDTSGKVPFKTTKDGDTMVRFRSGYIPKVFDARNKPFVRGPKGPLKDGREDPKTQTYVQEIGGGSDLKVRGLLIEYDGGITLALDQVQVVDLKTFEGGSAFDVEDDGYDGSTGGTADDSEGFTEADDTTKGTSDALDI